MLLGNRATRDNSNEKIGRKGRSSNIVGVAIIVNALIVKSALLEHLRVHETNQFLYDIKK